MNTSKKITLIVALMLIGLMTATIINVGLNFRDYGYNNARDKANMTAEIVRDGLTAHMVNNMMDKRDVFLQNIASAQDVEALWVVRSQKVTDQFGKGLPNEGPRDAIDKQVINSGTTVSKIIEDSQHARLRVTIPYVASAFDSPNCFKCHNVVEGDVLGAVSIEFNIDHIRNAGAMTMVRIFAINIIFILIAIWVTNHYIRPYMELFANLQEGIKRAHTGDFKYRFTTTVKGEGAEVAQQINTLFDKMQETFGEIKDNLTTFVARSSLSCSDPLHDAKSIIRELSDVYKFKKTIERDASKEVIYDRIIRIVTEKFHADHFALYEVNRELKERKLIHITEGKSFCSHASLSDPQLCRAFRNDTSVLSTDFPDLCQECTVKDINYLCIPYAIDTNISLVLSISSKDREKIEELNTYVSSIKNYLEAAKPVIESKILTSKLRDTSLRDGMTGLYNRRFLEEFIETAMKQAGRVDTKYSILMLDIDFFKMVNDTYGHDVGDIIIKGLADLLVHNTREADLVIRYGGEEFIVLLHNTSKEGAIELAEKIRKKFNAKRFDIGTDVLQKNISIGIAHFPAQGDSIWKIIKYADTALYEAKNTGRNKVVEFRPEMFTGDSF